MGKKCGYERSAMYEEKLPGVAKSYFYRFLEDMEEEFAWSTRMSLSGYTLKRKKNHWLLVVRAMTKKGEKQVAFIEAETRMQTFRILYTLVHCTNSGVSWHPDKYR